MKIKRAAFTLSPFTAEDTIKIGNALLKSIKDRIHHGLDVNDQPAAALKPALQFDGHNPPVPYPQYKTQHGRQAIRDLTNTGALMDSIQVVSVSQDGGSIAANNPVKDKILHINNVRNKQFGIAESDRKILNAAAVEVLKSKIKISE